MKKLLLMFFSVFIYGQDSITEKYYRERGYAIPPRNTHIEIPQPSYTNYLNLIPANSKTESIENNKQNINENKRKLVEDSIKAKAMKLSYADKKLVELNSNERILGGLKDNKLGLTEYENQSSHNNNNIIQLTHKEIGTILFCMIAFLILIAYYFKKKSPKRENKSNEFTKYKFTNDLIYKKIEFAEIVINEDSITTNLFPFISYNGTYKIINKHERHNNDKIHVVIKQQDNSTNKKYVITIDKNKIKIFDENLVGIILKK